MMKPSLVPHLLELSREIKVGFCSALFFALCFGGWAVLKTPVSDCRSNIESEREVKRESSQLAMGLKTLRWEQLQINRTFRKRLAEKETALAAASSEPDPVSPPVEPVESVDDSVPKQTARVEEIPENQIISRGGERPATVIKGSASWYGGGDGMDGRPTASGEIFDASQLTAAHRDLPFGTRLKVTYLNTGRSVVVRINDRGPFNYNLILDLSRAAAEEIGLISSGIGPVEIEILE